MDINLNVPSYTHQMAVLCCSFKSSGSDTVAVDTANGVIRVQHINSVPSEFLMPSTFVLETVFRCVVYCCTLLFQAGSKPSQQGGSSIGICSTYLFRQYLCLQCYRFRSCFIIITQYLPWPSMTAASTDLCSHNSFSCRFVSSLLLT